MRRRGGAMAPGLPAALLMLTLLVACDRGGGSSSTQTPTTYADWNAVVSARQAARAPQHPVVFIGLDGANWYFINELIGRGQLPNIARIRAEGARALLRSVDNYVTPPAWTSMLTGYRPEKTGVYTFGFWDPAKQEFLEGTSDDIRVPSVWDAASRAGLKTAVVNVPMTYPVHPVNGVMVSGIMTPIDVDRALSFKPTTEVTRDMYRAPPGIVDTREPIYFAGADSLNLILWSVHDSTKDGKTNYETIALRVLARDAKGKPGAELASFVFGNGGYSPWAAVHFRTGGNVVEAHARFRISVDDQGVYELESCPVVLPIDAPYTYPATLSAELDRKFGFYLPTKFFPDDIVVALARDMGEYMDFFYDYDDWDLFCFVFTQTDNVHHTHGFDGRAAEVYREIDSAIGRIMARMPDDATLVIASDHGFAEYEYGIDLNRVLASAGVLTYTSDGHIDFKNSLVFHNLWQLYLNRDRISVESLRRCGLVVPQGEDPVEFFKDTLVKSLADIRSPDGARSFGVAVSPVPADAVGDKPDLTVAGTYNDYMVEFWNIMRPRAQTMGPLAGSERFWHHRNGVFMMWGKGIVPNLDLGTQDITDVAPTILYLLGLPGASDMDGALITRALKSSTATLAINEKYRDIPREIILDRSQRESLQKKLRSLGYVQ